MSEAVADLRAVRVADKMSLRYLGDLRARLGRFVVSFGEEMIAGVSPSRIDEWLRGSGVDASDAQLVSQTAGGAFAALQSAVAK